MITRIVLLFVVLSALCTTAFTFGSKAASQQLDASGIPAGHPVALAMRYQQELGLSAEQIEKLTKIHSDMALEFAPFKAQAESIQQRMQALQQSGNPNPDDAKKLQQEGEDLGKNIQPIFERYGKQVAELLSQDQREKLMKLSEANSKQPSKDDFVLMTIMESRDQLGITPQQFTKLQFIQADFIKAFAPKREQMELWQMEVQQKFVKAHREPTDQAREIGEDLQKQVKELQNQFSDRAIHEVLDATQRTKLEELLHGKHSSAQNGG